MPGTPFEVGVPGTPFEVGGPGRPLEAGVAGISLEVGVAGFLKGGVVGMPLKVGGVGMPLEVGVTGMSLVVGDAGMSLKGVAVGMPLRVGGVCRSLEVGVAGVPPEPGVGGMFRASCLVLSLSSSMDVCLSKESFGLAIIGLRSVLPDEATSKSKTLWELGVGVGSSDEAVESFLNASVTRCIMTSAEGDTAKGGGVGRERSMTEGAA